MLLAFSLIDQQQILSVFKLLSEKKLISKLYVVEKGLITVETSCNRVRIIHMNFQQKELKVPAIAFFVLEQAEEVLFEGKEVVQVFNKVVTV